MEKVKIIPCVFLFIVISTGRVIQDNRLVKVEDHAEEEVQGNQDRYMQDEQGSRREDFDISVEEKDYIRTMIREEIPKYISHDEAKDTETLSEILNNSEKNDEVDAETKTDTDHGIKKDPAAATTMGEIKIAPVAPAKNVEKKELVVSMKKPAEKQATPLEKRKDSLASIEKVVAKDASVPIVEEKHDAPAAIVGDRKGRFTPVEKIVKKKAVATPENAVAKAVTKVAEHVKDIPVMKAEEKKGVAAPTTNRADDHDDVAAPTSEAGDDYDVAAAATLEDADPETYDDDNADPETYDDDDADPETYDGDADPETYHDADADPETYDDGDADPETYDDGDADPETYDDAHADPETYDDADADPETCGNADVDPETYDDADADPVTYGNGDADPETYDDGDADPETYDVDNRNDEEQNSLDKDFDLFAEDTTDNANVDDARLDRSYANLPQDEEEKANENVVHVIG